VLSRRRERITSDGNYSGARRVGQKGFGEAMRAPSES
jgi:hypothetical protein